jgi:NAD-dependent deacetylase
MVRANVRSIVILTGAGISKESGLDTFRDADGIWQKYRLEDVATPEAYARDPLGVQDFYNQRRRQLISSNVQPNAAHAALARLETAWRGTIVLVTQNIDDLHERAGSRNLIHMHGALREVRCTACAEVHQWDDDVTPNSACPACAALTTLRPNVVWFGEMPLQMERIYAALSDCQLFMSIGTSGNVYPAAGFVQEANTAGAHTVELNLEPSAGESHFGECRYGPATDLIPAYVEALLDAG